MKFLEQVRDYVRGNSVKDPHPAIRMFGLCESMKWNHLPRSGKLEDQDPDMLDRFQTIFAERGKHQAQEADERKKEMEKRSKSGSGVKRPARRGRR